MASFATPSNGNMASESTATPINGSNIDSSFPPAASLPQGAEASKTLWYVVDDSISRRARLCNR